jgi:DNA repair protein RadD
MFPYLCKSDAHLKMQLLTIVVNGNYNNRLMKYKLRDYQQEASDKAVEFFLDESKQYNALEMLSCGAGKSLIIANIASRLEGKVIVFQPNVEILRQNYAKYCSYGLDDASIYSASMNTKEIGEKVTFATIGSVKNSTDLFKDYKYIIVDEAQFCNPAVGMYKRFFDSLQCKILGLTATPYRLSSFKDYGSILKFMTRSKPKIFTELLYYVQTKDLVERGYLEKPQYYNVPPPLWNEGNLKLNSTCRDYTDESVKAEFERSDLYKWLVNIVTRLMHPKDGSQRSGILVFTRFVDEAKMLTYTIPGCAIVTGETPKAERKQILDDFRDGKIKVLANANCLSEGFDYPELDTVVMARPTRSLAKYTQVAGRCMRLRQDGKKKVPWFVDLCGNYKRFGKIEEQVLVDQNGKGKWVIMNGNKQLTNKFF